MEQILAKTGLCRGGGIRAQSRPGGEEGSGKPDSSLIKESVLVSPSCVQEQEETPFFPQNDLSSFLVPLPFVHQVSAEPSVRPRGRGHLLDGANSSNEGDSGSAVARSSLKFLSGRPASAGWASLDLGGEGGLPPTPEFP